MEIDLKSLHEIVAFISTERDRGVMSESEILSSIEGKYGPLTRCMGVEIDKLLDHDTHIGGYNRPAYNYPKDGDYVYVPSAVANGSTLNDNGEYVKLTKGVFQKVIVKNARFFTFDVEECLCLCIDDSNVNDGGEGECECECGWCHINNDSVEED